MTHSEDVDLDCLSVAHLLPLITGMAELLLLFLDSQELFSLLLLFPEVTLKVHVSDASTHQPIADALIEIFANQVSIASGTSGTDGVAFVKFQYKLGSQLIVTATKHAYVPNSAPWKPIRLPGKVFLIFV